MTTVSITGTVRLHDTVAVAELLIPVSDAAWCCKFQRYMPIAPQAVGWTVGVGTGQFALAG